MSIFKFIKKEKSDISSQNETTDTNVENDDILFETLAAEKKKKKRRKIIRTVIIVVLVALLLIFGVSFLRRKVKKSFASSDDEILSAEATKGNISTTVSGSGILANVDEVTLTIPANVEIEEIVVEANDKVKVGDVIAEVDMPSVMSAMATVQEEIDDLDDELYDAKDDIVSSYIASGVTGRVKKLYAQKGDSVSQVMYDNGSLALLSLDGYMYVEIETDKLSVGDKVAVIRSDEKSTELEGIVDEAFNGTAKILVTDNGPGYEEEVTVKDSSGTQLGKGKLYINSCLKVSGIAGTISGVNADENTKVYNGTTIFGITDTAYTANYQTILGERNEKEEELAELLRIYTDGAFTAIADGSISSILYDEDDDDDDDTETLVAQETDVVTFSPDRQMSVTIYVDESKIMSLELDQTAEITINSIDDETYEGTVTEINKTATSDSGVTRYTAVVTFDKDENMLPGMSASVAIRIQGVDDAVIIPIDALHQTSSMSFVYTSYDEENMEYGGLVEVETGISNSSYVEITSGLKEGDVVYYTESESSFMPSMDFPGGGDFGGMSGGGDFGGMPSGGGGMPSGGGGMPGGGGGMPGGRQ